MARQSLADISTLLNMNPRYLAYLQAEALSANPLVSCQDVVVLPNATSATLTVSLNVAPRDTIIGSWLTRNGTGTNQGTNYVAASGPIIFQPGGPTTQQITIQLKGNNVVGNTIQVLIGATLYGAKLGKQIGTISFATVLPAASSNLSLLFSHDFASADFAYSATGKDANGNPCWQSTLDHNRRTQPGNLELGYYSDPSVVPACNPFPIDVTTGKRALQMESFPNGVLDVNGNPILCPWHVVNGVEQPFQYTSCVLNSSKWPAAQVPPNSRIECSIAMPFNGSPGLWPGFWLLSTSGAWPPEIDMMEWPTIANGGYNPWTFFTTQHAPNGTGGDNRRGYAVDTRIMCGSTQDLTNFHTYGVNVEDHQISFDFDGMTYVTMDNRSPGVTWFILLDMTCGGWAGAPTAATVFPAKMLVDWLKIYQILVPSV